MLKLLAVVPQGLERETARELRALGGGIGKTHYRDGRIQFEGPDDAVYRCNLQLRTAERILVQVGQVRARTSGSLAERMADLAWEDWIPRDRPLRVVARARACRLYHTGAIEDAVLAGLALRGLGVEGARAAATGAREDRSPLTIDLRGSRDQWTVAVDTTGGELHLRGYRKQAGKAPVRETVAAALLQLAGWDGTRPLWDPMCGSGTFLVEAAWIAENRAPGLRRRFAFEDFPSLNRERWQDLQSKAQDRIDPSMGGSVIGGSDQDPRAAQGARANLKRAGLEGRVSAEVARLEDLDARSGEPGLVVLNPPYDRRLPAPGGGHVDPAEAWRRWGGLVRDLGPGWDALLLSPNPSWVEEFGGNARRLARFSHGGLKVGAWLVPAAS